MSQKTRTLVTGASAGIGLALVKKLLALGHTVFGCARNVDILKSLSCEGAGTVHPIVCDVSNEAQVKAMFEEINRISGGLDICVNNAGIGFNEPLLSGDPEKWRKMYEVNVIGLCMVTQNAVKCMKEGGGDDCRILNINSIFGIPTLKQELPFLSFYLGTKHAVGGITAALRGELSLSGLSEKIKVMQVYPGITKTEFVQRGYGEEMAKAVLSRPMPLEADDVADSIIHSLSTPKRAAVTDLVIHPTAQI